MARHLSLVKTLPETGLVISAGNADELARLSLRRRAVESAVWGMPLVSFETMRQAFFNAGADYGDILYLSTPADWKFQVPTPNSSSLYVYFNFNLLEGPLVIEFPAAEGAGLFGSIVDAWQTPLADVGPEGEDHGFGGQYLLLPPNFHADPPSGFIPLRFATHNGYAAFRVIPVTRSNDDIDRALALVRQVRTYLLAESSNPPPQRHIDIAGQLFEGIVPYDHTFYESLAKMVNEEPVQERDKALMGQLRVIGIEKGKPFTPGEQTRSVLRKAILEARSEFMDALVDHVEPYWPESRWGVPPSVGVGARTGFTFETESSLDIDARGATFFGGFAAPKRLGAASVYLLAGTDAEGASLDGGRSYRLRVPAHVPAKQFWAVTAYDLESAAFFRESPKTEVNSYQQLETLPDGSVDIFFGPKPPSGKESNWIYTAPGALWFSFFRLYAPDARLQDKTWKLNDIVPL